MQNRKFGAITSSVDPEKVSTTVNGIVVGLSSVIILVAKQFFHINLSANDIISLAAELSGGAASVAIVYGLLMKVLMVIFKQTPPPTTV